MSKPRDPSEIETLPTESLEDRLIDAAADLAARYVEELRFEAKQDNKTDDLQSRVRSLVEIIHDAKQRKVGLQ
jgi:hypothetical protein